MSSRALCLVWECIPTHSVPISDLLQIGANGKMITVINECETEHLIDHTHDTQRQGASPVPCFYREFGTTSCGLVVGFDANGARPCRTLSSLQSCAQRRHTISRRGAMSRRAELSARFFLTVHCLRGVRWRLQLWCFPPVCSQGVPERAKLDGTTDAKQPQSARPGGSAGPRKHEPPRVPGRRRSPRRTWTC